MGACMVARARDGTVRTRWRGMDAAHIVTLLRGGASERLDAYTALEEGSREGTVDAALAVQCLAPLAELLRQPVAQIDAFEFQRICLVVAVLCATDVVATGWWIADGTTAAWTSGNAFDAVLTKPPDEMTRADVLTMAAANAWTSATCAPGFSPAVEASGMDAQAVLGILTVSHPIVVCDVELRIRVVTLATEALADPATEVAPSHRVGLYWLIWGASARNGQILRHWIDCGFVSVLMSDLAKPAAVVELAPGTTPSSAACFCLTALYQPGLVDDELKQAVVSAMPGLLDALLDILRAYEAMETLDRVIKSEVYTFSLMLLYLLDSFPTSDGTPSSHELMVAVRIAVFDYWS